MYTQRLPRKAFWPYFSGRKMFPAAAKCDNVELYQWLFDQESSLSKRKHLSSMHYKKAILSLLSLHDLTVLVMEQQHLVISKQFSGL